MKNLWTLWAKALGEKAYPNNLEADKVALIRTAIVLLYIITNLFIISGIIRHWNDQPTNEQINKAYQQGYKEALQLEKPSEDLEIACAALWLRENDKKIPMQFNTFLNR